MRPSRFISIISVIALVVSVELTEAKANIYADDGLVSTTTVTTTKYGKATGVPKVIDKAPKSEDKDVGTHSRDRDKNNEYHTTIHYTDSAPSITEATSIHHVTETHRPATAPSNIISVTVQPPVQSAPALSTSTNTKEEVIIKTKTKKHKTKSKIKSTATAVSHSSSSSRSALGVKEIHTASTSRSVVSISNSVPTVGVATSSGMRSLVPKNPANMASVSSKVATVSRKMASASSSSSQLTAPTATKKSSSPSLALSSGNTSVVASSSPPSSVSALVSSTNLPTALASPPPAPSSSAQSSPAATIKPSSSSADVNNVNNKKVGPSSSPSSANTGQSDKSINRSLALTCIIAAVVVF
ncbi:hypothetical protein BCR42DRAFT_391468 [Absidia repens]|uniref:Uncharacterized protein n=1 Tax=Absidia repens TaxID=90262 RepID=A0A1X2IKB6_9FUNG|nr:hypothetical protein BCR42DRAFT_391468 [Absidia repens]